MFYLCETKWGLFLVSSILHTLQYNANHRYRINRNVLFTTNRHYLTQATLGYTSLTQSPEPSALEA